jgi:tRNA threonylcarbamoyladenosine biosynthesis protein TsaE
MMRQVLFLADDAATEALAHRLAKALRPGDLVLLSGDLGTGKTALARAVIRSLVGDDDLDVPSPSFALVQPYRAGETPLLHVDLYRLTDEREVGELGLFEQPDAIILVEWPERAPGLGSDAAIEVALSMPPGRAGRKATIRMPGDRSF